MTPSPGEQSQFAEYGKAISTFVAGYLVAKLDKLFDLSVAQQKEDAAVLIGQVSMFAAAITSGALFTFIWRQYLNPA